MSQVRMHCGVDSEESTINVQSPMRLDDASGATLELFWSSQSILALKM